ncbi:tRNA uridine-5-carboxymethylaminomethyl(34) synthesis GTPase MnmE [Sulfurimonas sp. MAG313]|nr:tRNA uridine-5-carboxymethylaminomethyl(34) synthesis GTPase MnmE [Sulfurimonas sp. MAG313]MDF1881605.1 tRNA uridine-5-carboxymethylaminomethyl(34) synthesis GTPase MnmE [Sulfurimonas sp. MAG313]
MMDDTIAAVATAHGIGSISIIRLSGEKSLDIALQLSHKTNFSVRYASLSPLYNQDNELIDEAIVIYFKGPNSFTAEDIVEFQCHGGKIVAEQVLNTVLAFGARLAEPGEFSKRAFLNGRIDLTEAEAIAALIEAKSEDAAKILAKQMKGELKGYIETIRDDLLNILAYSEVTIDYAEEDLPQDLIDQILQRLNTLSLQLSDTLQASQSRAGLMQGFKVAIIGKPNVGKSSLLNVLLHYKRAIVSDIAGTTRDTIEEEVKIGTHLIRMVDTAGIREANDEIERIGIQRSIEAIQASDIVIALFDNSREYDEEDEKILSLIKEHKVEKSFIILVNKMDLESKFDNSKIMDYSPIELSCKDNARELIQALSSIMDTKNVSDEMMLISVRQVNAVKQALQEIHEAKIPLEEQELEIFSFHMNMAIKDISSITRPFEHSEMLDKMFGNFCLGK